MADQRVDKLNYGAAFYIKIMCTQFLHCVSHIFILMSSNYKIHIYSKHTTSLLDVFDLKNIQKANIDVNAGLNSLRQRLKLNKSGFLSNPFLFLS